jgi:UDP-glucose 4-epimerase
LAAWAPNTRPLGWRPALEDVDTIVASAWQWRERHPSGYRTGARG